MSRIRMEDTSKANGAELIAAERQRQVIDKKYTAEHDDQHTGGELALVAALLASPILLYRKKEGPDAGYADPWPESWDRRWDQRPYYGGKVRPNHDVSLGTQDRIRQLEKAGALIAAEIDRLLRVQETLTEKVAEELSLEL